jgi:GNAT superfamily N-acetyltransferase
MEQQGNLHIRDARDGDRVAMVDVTLAAYDEYSVIIPSPHWEEYQQDIRNTITEDAQAERIVAELDGVVVGSVILYPAGTVFHLPDGEAVTLQYPEIRLLAVAPASRRKGVGVALVDACIERARQAGAEAVTLHTIEFMQIAMRMYERMGFERAPELDFRPVEDDEVDVVIKGYRFNLG